MIRAQPLSLAHKLKNIVDICEAADAAIDEQNLIKKGALDTGKENDGIEPAVVRKILARRKKIAKDPAETTRLEDLMTDYQFMLGEGREDTRPWTQTDDEISRVMALTNTSKPPKIEAIKKALNCSQGKAHKLRSIVAVRLAKKSSSSSAPREHEHLPEKTAPSGAPTPLTPFSAGPDDGVGAGTQTDADSQHAGNDPVPEVPAASQKPETVDGDSERRPDPVGCDGAGANSVEVGLPKSGRDGEASAERAASASSSPPNRGERAEPLGASGLVPVCTLTNGTPAASIPADDLTIPPFLKRERVAA